MSPIRPSECWSDVENQGFIFFDDNTFGGPQCRTEQTITKSESNILFIEGVMERDLVITSNHIWIFWEAQEVHYETNKLGEHYYPSDHWFYDMHWSVPSYAPSGLYRAKFQVNGYINRDDDIEVIDETEEEDENQSSDGFLKDGDLSKLKDKDDTQNINYEGVRYSIKRKNNKLKNAPLEEGKVVGCFQFYFDLK
eukprot:403356059